MRPGPAPVDGSAVGHGLGDCFHGVYLKIEDSIQNRSSLSQQGEGKGEVYRMSMTRGGEKENEDHDE
jgi:hypothetical protein